MNNQERESQVVQGWAIIDEDSVDCKGSKNHHVLAARITIDGDGTRSWRRAAEKTVCKQDAVADLISNATLCVTDEEVRNAITNGQNEGAEMCGVCMSHFLKDKD